jgi:hypothetical protein
VKRLKKIYNVCALVLVLTFVTPMVLPYHNVIKASAATIKLSEKELSLTVGESKTLKVTGTKSKVTWSSSKKSVATVSKTGKVKGIKAGKALITATVGKKNFICKIVVNNPVRPEVTNAPFTAQELTYNNIKCIIPKDWTENSLYDESYITQIEFCPTATSTLEETSYVSITFYETGEPKYDYSEIRKYYDENFTEANLKADIELSGISATLSDMSLTDYESKIGPAAKMSYKLTYSDGVVISYTEYELSIDNYAISIFVLDLGDTPEINTVTEYLLDTIKITK